MYRGRSSDKGVEQLFAEWLHTCCVATPASGLGSLPQRPPESLRFREDYREVRFKFLDTDTPDSRQERVAASARDEWQPTVLIAHDFAGVYGGAERIAGIIAEAFPNAPFWAILGRADVARRMGVEDRFHTVLPEREVLLKRFRWLTPLYPAIVRARPLPPADVLLTSSFAFANAFRTRNSAPQVCYCYSPLRFAWSMTDEYGANLGRGAAGVHGLRVLAAGMRWADRRAAAGVTRYIAESRFIADQIDQFYGRSSEVVWPPVDCKRFHPPSQPGHDGYFLFCGRLIEPYKRASIVIEAFRTLPHKLIVAGDGPALSDLRRAAGPNVEFVGQLDDERLIPLMQRCAGVIFPSRDDFGLIPVEVMACGRPALAYAAGGALETVVPGLTGEFFTAQTAEALRDAVIRFDPDAYDPAQIRKHAELWRTERFVTALRTVVDEVARHQRAGMDVC